MRRKKTFKVFASRNFGKGLHKTVNLPSTICNHVIGEEHTEKHRMVVGSFVAIAGVFIAKLPVGHLIGHVFFEAIGFFIHCVGAFPFVERAIKVAKKMENDAEKKG